MQEKGDDMSCQLIDVGEMDFRSDEKYVIYGAGLAGKMISLYLKDNKINDFVFCDRKEELHNTFLEEHLITEFGKALNEGYCNVLVGFINNDETKIVSVLEDIKTRIKNDCSVNIYVIDVNQTLISNSYTHFLKRILSEVKGVAKKPVNEVKNICFLSYGFSPEAEKSKNKGGPVGACNMQKAFLGEKYKDYNLIFPYFDEHRNSYEFDRFSYISDSIYKAKQFGETLENTVFFANDVFVAYGLKLSGARYSIIWHAQGDMVQEMTLWGMYLSEKEKELFYQIEKEAICGANTMYFPSNGAAEYFRSSCPLDISFNIGHPLYNTINDFPIISAIEGITKEDDCITILSIGQMTLLKGMDRIPEFIRDLADYSGEKIRWICVANGVLKNSVYQSMEEICNHNCNIEFVGIDHVINHSEVFYLLSISDVYLMLHRVSIFDFSTLEAMYMGKTILLSNIPGNDEFNVNDNIMLVEPPYNYDMVMECIKDKSKNAENNKMAYSKCFSTELFRSRYCNAMDDLLEGSCDE